MTAIRLPVRLRVSKCVVPFPLFLFSFIICGGINGLFYSADVCGSEGVVFRVSVWQPRSEYTAYFLYN